MTLVYAAQGQMWVVAGATVSTQCREISSPRSGCFIAQEHRSPRHHGEDLSLEIRTLLLFVSGIYHYKANTVLSSAAGDDNPKVGGWDKGSFQKLKVT